MCSLVHHFLEEGRRERMAHLLAILLGIVALFMLAYWGNDPPDDL